MQWCYQILWKTFGEENITWEKCGKMRKEIRAAIDDFEDSMKENRPGGPLKRKALKVR